jgi:hypothetical protein
VNGWLLIALVALAGAACPLHMWWQHRRGRRATCCVPSQAPENDRSLALEAVRARQAELAAQIHELDSPRGSAIDFGDRAPAA